MVLNRLYGAMTYYSYSKKRKIKGIMVGIDLVKVSRIKDLLLETPDIRDRIFTASEIEYCESFKSDNAKYERYAARFAAKEAVLKLIQDISLDSLSKIEILHKSNGAPYVVLSPDLKALFPDEIVISITHEYPFVVVIAQSACNCSENDTADCQVTIKEGLKERT